MVLLVIETLVIKFVDHISYTGEEPDAANQPVSKQGHGSSQLQLAVSEATINVRRERKTRGTDHTGEIFNIKVTHLQMIKCTAGKRPVPAPIKQVRILEFKIFWITQFNNIIFNEFIKLCF